MTQKSQNIFDKLLEFINYWWFRYLMVTELYIVERWERVVIHVFFLVVFLLQWYFNQTVLLRFTGALVNFGTFLTTGDSGAFASSVTS
ncbi:uncharacterized protein LOC134829627 [Culicoides brevitarsis]|uniref:uncharacterized protein LOC134829627 n=1 Tax=Culicoides brevitarsis TaxID=469753 RepID=UPI00307C86D1